MRIESLLEQLTDTSTSPLRRRLAATVPFRLSRSLTEDAIDLVRGPGVDIYREDWDLLVVVDACRYDLFEEVASDYSFTDGLRAVRSRASMTRYWMRENFRDEFADQMTRTAYVCGNPISGQELEESQFHTLDEPWRYAWDDGSMNTLPARPVTDRAIDIARADTADYDRLLVHYLQPHCPFVTRPELTRGKTPESFTDQSWDDIWMRLENGEIGVDTVWEGYRDNLRYALDEVEILLDNVDANRAIVTSDHGNAVGEWDIYGHPPHRAFGCLRTVPWVETTARDTGSHVPATREADADSDSNVTERLRALGYSE